MRPEDVPEGPLLVDTDVFTFLTWRSGKSRWTEFAALVDGHPLALPFAVIAELRSGAIKAVRSGVWTADKAERLDEAIRKVGVVPPTAAVTDHWAELHSVLHDRLKGGGVNDMWIAACALAYEVPVVTANRADFDKIAAEFDDLKIIHPDL